VFVIVVYDYVLVEVAGRTPWEVEPGYVSLCLRMILHSCISYLSLLYLD
jgi:hypothetical protein